MVDYIKFLPEELQRKIFYMSLEHPTAKIMKPLINEINDMPTYYINFKKNKIIKLFLHISTIILLFTIKK